MLPARIRRRRGWDESGPQMQQLWNQFFSPWAEMSEEDQRMGIYPVDIREEEGKLIVDAEMPGFRKEDIDIRIDKGVLRICAQREPEEDKGTKHLSERRYTRIDRSFTLPTTVEEENVQASLEEGVLHLELPEAQESKPRKIEVK